MTQYPVSNETFVRIENEFTYHAPFGDQQARYAVLRDEAKALALLIVAQTPRSREQSLALTHLETALMFANAAIARNEKAGQLPYTYIDPNRQMSDEVLRRPRDSEEITYQKVSYGGHNLEELPDSSTAGGDPIPRHDLL